MNGIAIGLGLLGVVATIVFLAWPWWGQPSKDNQGETVDDRYEAVLTALRDLDFDHALGKVTKEDYGPLRQDLLLQAAGIMAQLDEQTGADLELQILDPCRACGRIALSDDQFCAGCGIELSPAHSECPQCRRMASPGDLYCRKCGAELVPSPARPSLERTLEVRA